MSKTFARIFSLHSSLADLSSFLEQYTREGAQKRYENYTFYNYLCYAEDPFPDQINPLRLLTTLVQHGWITHLMDMTGVALDGLDISHAIACEILEVPCDDGWVRGTDRYAVLRNQRSGDAHLTEEQYQAFETVLLQHDCSYVERLRPYQHLFMIHHWQELWKNCDSYPQTSIDSLGNFSDVVNVLRDIIECPLPTVQARSADPKPWRNHYQDGTINLLSLGTLLAIAYLSLAFRHRGGVRHRPGVHQHEK